MTISPLLRVTVNGWMVCRPKVSPVHVPATAGPLPRGRIRQGSAGPLDASTYPARLPDVPDPVAVMTRFSSKPGMFCGVTGATPPE